jgi:hypothetical protein
MLVFGMNLPKSATAAIQLAYLSRAKKERRYEADV